MKLEQAEHGGNLMLLADDSDADNNNASATSASISPTTGALNTDVKMRGIIARLISVKNYWKYIYLLKINWEEILNGSMNQDNLF